MRSLLTALLMSLSNISGVTPDVTSNVTSHVTPRHFCCRFSISLLMSFLMSFRCLFIVADAVTLISLPYSSAVASDVASAGGASDVTSLCSRIF